MKRSKLLKSRIMPLKLISRLRQFKSPIRSHRLERLIQSSQWLKWQVKKDHLSSLKLKSPNQNLLKSSQKLLLIRDNQPEPLEVNIRHWMRSEPS